MRLQGEQWLPELCDEPPKDEKKKDGGKLARKDKDPGHRCGGKARNKWPKGKGNKLNNPVLLGKATYARSVLKFLTVSVDPRSSLRLRALWLGWPFGSCLVRLTKLVSKHRAQVADARNTEGGGVPGAGEDA